jgi:hypothetical protein
MNRSQRERAFASATRGQVRPCLTCGGSQPDSPMTSFGTPDACQECGEPVDRQGSALGQLMPDGTRAYKVFLFSEPDISAALRGT